MHERTGESSIFAWVILAYWEGGIGWMIKLSLERKPRIHAPEENMRPKVTIKRMGN